MERKFASLTAGLLARKGEAEPAMDGFSRARIAPIEPINAAGAAREEGRRTRPAGPPASGETAPAEALSGETARPEKAPPEKISAEDAPRMAHRAAAPADETAFAEHCPRRNVAASPKRAAVTFRMSVHDFLRLKLGAAELEVSSQEIIIAAVEAYLDARGVERLDECACLAKAAEAAAAVCGERAEEA